MKRHVLHFALVLLSATAIAGAAETFDWPQWQGPDRNAVSRERGLLKEWPKDGPPLAWKVKGLGGGYSAPAVAGGRIFGMSNRGEDEVTWALSETDGKELWVTRLGHAFPQQAPQGKEGPACTPTVDGEHVYTSGPLGDLYAINTRTHKPDWHKNIWKDFGGGGLPQWAIVQNPLIYGTLVIVAPQTSQVFSMRGGLYSRLYGRPQLGQTKLTGCCVIS